MKKLLALSALCLMSISGAIAQNALPWTNYEFTNYVKSDADHLRLWVPPTTHTVRGVVVAFEQNQEPVSLDPELRKICSAEDLAIAWISNLGENGQTKLEEHLSKLAESCGMPEVATAPYALVAHSTAGIWCRTIAKAKPERCFAIVQLNAVDFRDNEALKDVPWLCVKNCSEETGDNWEQSRFFMVNDKVAYANPEGIEGATDDKEWTSPRGNGCRIAQISLLGGGHFGYSPWEAKLVATFLRKAAHYQIGADNALSRVAEEDGWLTDPNVIDGKAEYAAASYATYEGPKDKAFWHIDEEMALLWEDSHKSELAKAPQTLSLSTFDCGGNNVWQKSRKPFNVSLGGLETPYTTDAASDVEGNPIGVKIYHGVFKVVDNKDLYYSPARYNFYKSDEWITFYQPGTETHRYAEITTGRVQASSIPAGENITASAIADQDITVGTIDYNVAGSSNIDDWVVAGNVYKEGDKWVIDPNTSVPRLEVYIRHAALNHSTLKETSFVITNSRANQTVAFDNSVPTEISILDTTPINLKATSTAADAQISYVLVGGPAILDGDKLTSTGETGTITVMAIATSKSANPGKAVMEINAIEGSGVSDILLEGDKISFEVKSDRVVVKNAPVGAAITLVDIAGRVVNSTEAVEGENDLSLVNLTNGVYLLNVDKETIKVLKR